MTHMADRLREVIDLLSQTRHTFRSKQVERARLLLQELTKEEELARAVSIWLQEETEKAINQRTQKNDGDSRSQLIGTIVARYEELISRSIPKLTIREWLACAEALTPAVLPSNPRQVARIHHELEEATLRRARVPLPDGIIETVEHLPYAGKLALVDVIERLWCEPKPSPAVFTKRLEEWGVVS